MEERVPSVGAFALAEKPVLSAPYVAYATFKNTVRGLAPSGELPSQIDHSVLGKMSGSARSQFTGALRFLGLIDDEGAPQEDLLELAVSNEQDWKSTLSPFLESYYSAETLEALRSGTPKTLAATLAASNPSTVRPAVRFLIKAARDCDIPVGHHIDKGIVSANGTARPRRRSSSSSSSASRSRKPRNRPGSSQTTADTATQALLAKFPEFDPSWPEDQQASWFKAYERLLTITSDKGGDASD